MSFEIPDTENLGFVPTVNAPEKEIEAAAANFAFEVQEMPEAIKELQVTNNIPIKTIEEDSTTDAETEPPAKQAAPAEVKASEVAVAESEPAAEPEKAIYPVAMVQAPAVDSEPAA